MILLGGADMHVANTWKAENRKQNEENNALVVMSNFMARATTKWSVEETKLFLMTISQISSRDDDCWITLNRSEVIERLGYDAKTSRNLRSKCDSMISKSFVQYSGKDSATWHDGFLFYNVVSNRKTLKIQVNKAFLPHLEMLTSHFTEFYLDNIVGFKHKASVSLYMWLTSWADFDYVEHHVLMKSEDIPKVFNLSPGAYKVDIGKSNERFHYGNFYKIVLGPAIKEINENRGCDLMIMECKKVKKGGFVDGYEFGYAYFNKTEKGSFLKVSEDADQIGTQ